MDKVYFYDCSNTLYFLIYGILKNKEAENEHF